MQEPSLRCAVGKLSKQRRQAACSLGVPAVSQADMAPACSYPPAYHILPHNVPHTSRKATAEQPGDLQQAGGRLRAPLAPGPPLDVEPHSVRLHRRRHRRRQARLVRHPAHLPTWPRWNDAYTPAVRVSWQAIAALGVP